MNDDLNFKKFKNFIQFITNLFQDKDLLKNVSCKQSFKDYFFKYYYKLLGQQDTSLSPKHIKWFRRLQPVLTLPKESIILDFGGGYGMDTIFLASCGYHIIFCEQTLNHVAICEHLKKRWEENRDHLNIQMVLYDNNISEKIKNIDAIILDEVAHHIEPVSDVFKKCFKMLRKDGHLFLLEPNFYNPVVQLFFLRVRGLKTVRKKIDKKTGQIYYVGDENIRSNLLWNTIAKKEGFKIVGETYICPYFLKTDATIDDGNLRNYIESKFFFKHLLSSHITYHYKK